MHTKYSSGDFFDHNFFCLDNAIEFFAQIRNAEETLVLSDALLLAARVSCSSKQVVNNNDDNNSDDHEMKKNGLATWQVF